DAGCAIDRSCFPTRMNRTLRLSPQQLETPPLAAHRCACLTRRTPALEETVDLRNSRPRRASRPKQLDGVPSPSLRGTIPTAGVIRTSATRAYKDRSGT